MSNSVSLATDSLVKVEVAYTATDQVEFFQRLEPDFLIFHVNMVGGQRQRFRYSTAGIREGFDKCAHRTV